MTNRYVVKLNPGPERPAHCLGCGEQLPAQGAIYQNPEGDALCWVCFRRSVASAARPGGSL